VRWIYGYNFHICCCKAETSKWSPFCSLIETYKNNNNLGPLLSVCHDSLVKISENGVSECSIFWCKTAQINMHVLHAQLLVYLRARTVDIVIWRTSFHCHNSLARCSRLAALFKRLVFCTYITVLFLWRISCIYTDYYFKHNQHFYLDVSVSARHLHQKKLVQFFFRFLPR